jgi:hypothetical protein
MVACLRWTCSRTEGLRHLRRGNPVHWVGWRLTNPAADLLFARNRVSSQSLILDRQSHSQNIMEVREKLHLSGNNSEGKHGATGAVLVLLFPCNTAWTCLLPGIRAYDSSLGVQYHLISPGLS